MILERGTEKGKQIESHKIKGPRENHIGKAYCGPSHMTKSNP